jgi:hypothetical protein
MIVTGKINVEVDPKEVIKSLLDKELGGGTLGSEPSEVSEELTKYYIEHHVDSGPHTVIEKKYISLEEYKFIYNLTEILKHMGIVLPPRVPSIQMKARPGSSIFGWF